MELRALNAAVRRRGAARWRRQSQRILLFSHSDGLLCLLPCQADVRSTLHGVTMAVAGVAQLSDHVASLQAQQEQLLALVMEQQQMLAEQHLLLQRLSEREVDREREREGGETQGGMGGQPGSSEESGRLVGLPAQALTHSFSPSVSRDALLQVECISPTTRELRERDKGSRMFRREVSSGTSGTLGPTRRVPASGSVGSGVGALSLPALALVSEEEGGSLEERQARAGWLQRTQKLNVKSSSQC